MPTNKMGNKTSSLDSGNERDQNKFKKGNSKTVSHLHSEDENDPTGKKHRSPKGKEIEKESLKRS